MWQQPAPGQTAPVEYRMYYADFRDVNGMKWPFRIRRAVGGQTIEETTFDRVRINTKIDAKKFEAPK
jgi:predicted thioesterase